jgi:nucleotide-binding universal stress UspA family protein
MGDGVFHRLLVPLDGRPQSAVALDMARLLGQPSVAEVTPLRGTVVPEVLSAASDAGADLIVLSTHVEISLGQPRLNTTAAELTSGSPCSVVLVPDDGHRPAGLQTIVVLVTAPGRAESGLGAAARLAQMVRARLRLVLVQRSGRGTTALRQARRRIERMATRLTRVGVHASATALEGDLPTLLAQAAETDHADLIAMRYPCAADLEQFDCGVAGVLAATHRSVLLAKP